MSIFVLIKQTFDTEEKVVLTDGVLSEDGIKWVINPYDEYALEEAMRWKEAHGGTVTVLTAGPERSQEALRTALAMGADDAIHIVPPEGRGTSDDEYIVSSWIASILQEQQPDIIFGGHFSVDQGSAQVAVRVATLLNMPHVSAITGLERTGDSFVQVQRDAEGNAELLDVSLPALFTAQQGLNEPRYPSLPGIMKAKRKPIRVVSAAELSQEAALEPRTERLALEPPPPRQAGRMIAGDAAAQVQELIRLLHEEAKCL
ncbi:electron transfer flavoprotein subunit beta/FixA family protein [Paenibacillus sp. OSY-SE]|uniref:electron transfer flavoprotein subunit beta/FixA family protein n=1 Tax=Paenibacillus sp. OSY-SE TaxID=1196323 RepID=UPI00031B6A92|nr:electron transfer flavoprotein subunit beta/FixA family protein [Paenibacillus sp. OSY-SE]